MTSGKVDNMVILHHIPDSQDRPFPCDICGASIDPLASHHICNERLIIIYTNWEDALENGLAEYMERKGLDKGYW